MGTTEAKFILKLQSEDFEKRLKVINEENKKTFEAIKNSTDAATKAQEKLASIVKEKNDKIISSNNELTNSLKAQGQQEDAIAKAVSKNTKEINASYKDRIDNAKRLHLEIKSEISGLKDLNSFRNAEAQGIKTHISALSSEATSINTLKDAVRKLKEMKKEGKLSNEEYNASLKTVTQEPIAQRKASIGGISGSKIIEEKNYSEALKQSKKSIDDNEKSLSNLANTTIRYLRWTGTIAGVVYAGQRAWDLTLGKGIEVNKMIEDNTTGIAALLGANTSMILSNGQVVNSYEKFQMGLSKSKEIMDDIRVAAKSTYATFPQLTEIYQQAIGQTLSFGTSFGKTVDDISNNTIKLAQRMSNIGGSIGQPMDRIKEEIRSLVSGNVSTDSIISTMIFGSPSQANEAIKKAKETGTNGLKDMLESYLKAFDVLEGVKTYTKAQLDLQDAISQTQGQLAEPTFNALKDVFSDLALEINKMKDDKTFEEWGKNIVAVAKAIVDMSDEVVVALASFLGWKLIAPIIESVTKSFGAAQIAASQLAVQGKATSTAMIMMSGAATTAKTALMGLASSLAPLAAVMVAYEGYNWLIGDNIEKEEKLKGIMANKIDDLNKISSTQLVYNKLLLEESLIQKERDAWKTRVDAANYKSKNNLTDLSKEQEAEQAKLNVQAEVAKQDYENTKQQLADTKSILVTRDNILKKSQEINKTQKELGDLTVKLTRDSKVEEDTKSFIKKEEEEIVKLAKQKKEWSDKLVESEKSLSELRAKYSDKNTIKFEDIDEVKKQQEYIKNIKEGILKTDKAISEENTKNAKKTASEQDATNRKAIEANKNYAEELATKYEIEALQNKTYDSETYKLDIAKLRVETLQTEYNALDEGLEKEKTYRDLLLAKLDVEKQIEIQKEKTLATIKKQLDTELSYTSRKIELQPDSYEKTKEQAGMSYGQKVLDIEYDSSKSVEEKEKLIELETELYDLTLERLEIERDWEYKETMTAFYDDMLESQIELNGAMHEWGDSFGVVGSAMEEVSKTMSKVTNAELKSKKEIAKLDDKYAKEFKKYAKDETKTKKLLIAYEEEQQELKEQTLMNQIDGLSEFAGAAKGFFGEQTAAYKTLNALEVAGHAIKMANMAAELPSKMVDLSVTIATALAGQGSIPIVGFALVAGMAALLAGLGVMSAGGGGGSAPSGGGSQKESQFDIKEKQLEDLYTPMTDRLDRQIQLLESIDKQGSASALGLEAAKVSFQRDYALAVNEINKGLKNDLQIKEWVNITNINNALAQAESTMGFNLADIVKIKKSGWDKSENRLIADFDQLSSGFNMLKTIATYFEQKEGYGAIEFLFGGSNALNLAANEIQGVIGDFTQGIVDSLDDMKDASADFKEHYDEITGSMYYENKRLAQAFEDVNTLRGNTSFTDYLKKNIDAIDTLSATFTDAVLETLLSQDPKDMAKQIVVLEDLEAKTGMVFANGARDALDFMESIELVSEAMVSSKENIKEWTESLQTESDALLLNTKDLSSNFIAKDISKLSEYVNLFYQIGLDRETDAGSLQYWNEQVSNGNIQLENLFSTMSAAALVNGEQVSFFADNMEQLSSIFNLMANDIDGLTDSELEFLEANKEMIDGIQELKNTAIGDIETAIKSYLPKATNTFSQVDSLLSSGGNGSNYEKIISTIDNAYKNEVANLNEKFKLENAILNKQLNTIENLEKFTDSLYYSNQTEFTKYKSSEKLLNNSIAKFSELLASGGDATETLSDVQKYANDYIKYQSMTAKTDAEYNFAVASLSNKLKEIVKPTTDINNQGLADSITAKLTENEEVLKNAIDGVGLIAISKLTELRSAFTTEPMVIELSDLNVSILEQMDILTEILGVDNYTVVALNEMKAGIVGSILEAVNAVGNIPANDFASVVDAVNNITIPSFDTVGIIDAVNNIPTTDVNSIVDAVNNIPEVDNNNVVDAINNIPTVSFDTVTEAINNIPTIDNSNVVDAIANIPTVDLTSVTTAVENIPTTDLNPVVEAVNNIPEVDLLPVVDAVANIPTVSFDNVTSAIENIPVVDFTTVVDAVSNIPLVDFTNAIQATEASADTLATTYIESSTLMTDAIVLSNDSSTQSLVDTYTENSNNVATAIENIPLVDFTSNIEATEESTEILVNAYGEYINSLSNSLGVNFNGVSDSIATQANSILALATNTNAGLVSVGNSTNIGLNSLANSTANGLNSVSNTTSNVISALNANTSTGLNNVASTTNNGLNVVNTSIDETAVILNTALGNVRLATNANTTSQEQIGTLLRGNNDKNATLLATTLINNKNSLIAQMGTVATSIISSNNAGYSSLGSRIDITKQILSNNLLSLNSEQKTQTTLLGKIAESLNGVKEVIYDANPINSIVKDFYKNALGREADTQGFNYWRGQLLKGDMDVNSLYQLMTDSAKGATGTRINYDYLSGYGIMSNTTYNNPANEFANAIQPLIDKIGVLESKLTDINNNSKATADNTNDIVTNTRQSRIA